MTVIGSAQPDVIKVKVYVSFNIEIMRHCFAFVFLLVETNDEWNRKES